MATAPDDRRRARAAAGFLAGVALAVAPAGAGADMISKEGMAPWEVCGLCHGLDGLSATAKFPRLAGQKPAYIAKQIRDIRAGRRTNDGGQMSAIVTEIAAGDIAAWFAGQTPPEPDRPGGDADRGAALFAERGCADCHGPGAAPPGDMVAPHLFAQHERYLAKQLADFREGRRANDPDGVIRARAGALSDTAIAALAAYLASRVRP